MATAAAAAAAAPAPYTVVENGDVKATGVDSKGFLEASPRGPYTTARTVAGTRVFELEAHIERLASTAALMWPDEQGLPAAMTDPATLKPLLLQTLRSAIHHYRETHPSSAEEEIELKLTILMVWHSPSDAVDCLCHVGPLPPIPSPPIKVEVRGAPRHNAKAKDSQWVRDRNGLEALKPTDVNEIILHDADGRLLEGTQTNFYVVTAEGALQTAGGGLVLEGTVRRLILQVCAAEGIPVDETPPRLTDLESWQGVLISSTSRLALPVDWVGVPKEGQAFDAAGGDVARSLAYPDGSLTKRIVALVAARVLDASTPVL